jgi:hypothetical protein
MAVQVPAQANDEDALSRLKADLRATPDEE